MEKDHFLFLIKNYTSLTAEEAGELTVLPDYFPYSQVVHNLAARAAQDNDVAGRERLLHVSAIYTTDRTLLKSLMTAPRSLRAVDAPSVKSQPAKTIIPAPSPSAPPDAFATHGTIELSGEALRNDIRLEIKKLQVAKHNFEVIVTEFEKVNPPGEKVQKKVGRKSQKPVEPANLLMEEIKTAKKKVTPEGKQKEQIEIIENFIKTKPSIKKGGAVTDNTDLAEKSLLYGDNIVSETLVGILLKQGKKDKAIEVLKKLIWKFPQKKAYFAAQIEDLKT